MNDHVEVLLKEYHVLLSQVEKWTAPLYNIVPILITAGGYVLINGADRGRVATGASVVFGLLVVALWVSFVHSMMNANFLRVVDIEQRVNELIGVKGAAGLNWHSSGVGEGYRLNRGYLVPVAITLSMGIGVYGLGVVFLWIGMKEELECSDALRGSVIAVVIGVAVAICENIRRTEGRIRLARNRLVSEYVEIQVPGGSSTVVE